MRTRADFVGRDAELALIEAGIEAVLRGEPRVVVCQGEAGIGKTRLAEEAVVRAAARGLITAWGVADDVTPTPPHWPWQQVLRTLDRNAGMSARFQDERLARELSRVVSDGGSSDVVAAASDEDRFRQFDAVARVLALVCRAKPLALIFDDVHWADEASLLLLRHVVSCLSDERLLLWVNARETEQRHPELLEQIARRPQVRHLLLGGLARPAVRQKLESMTSRAVTTDEVATVHAVTGGNPFFVTEAARALRRAGERRGLVTAGTRNAISARLGKLPEEAVRGLRGAAVLGREFVVSVLALMTGTPELECLRWLGVADRAGIVEPAEPGAYRFVHAIFRDAIEEGLDRDERVRLHRHAAVAIEAHHPTRLDDHLFELARHWMEAAPGGDRATAAGWLERAAGLAMAQLAYEDAVRLYRQALTVGGTDLDDESRWRLLLGVGRAANRAGALGECLDVCLETAASARERGRVDVLAEAALVMDPVGQAGFDVATRRLCQEALGEVGVELTPLRARLSARLAETYIYLPDTDTAAAASEQAVAIAEQCGDLEALSAALRARQVVVSHPDGLDERERVAARMVALGERAATPDVELRGRLCAIDALFERGDLTAVAAELDRCDHCASEVGGPLAPYLVLHTRAVLAAAQGRLGEARRIADQALGIAGSKEHPDIAARRAAVLSTIARQAGHDPALLSAGEVGPAERDVADEGLRVPFIGVLARADVLVTAARSADAADIWRRLGPARRWRPPPHVMLLAGALGIEVAAAVGSSDDMDALSARLLPYRGRHVACGLGAAAYLGPVELWLGKAARHLGRIDDAIADLRDALLRCRDNGAAGFEVEATYELAAARAARATDDDRDEALALLRRAGAMADDLGMAVTAGNIGELLRRLRAPKSGPLTRREWEIAELVATGLSNREIVERLTLSERTAQNHVQHILTKLGLPNRAQVAVWFDRSQPRK